MQPLTRLSSDLQKTLQEKQRVAVRESRDLPRAVAQVQPAADDVLPAAAFPTRLPTAYVGRGDSERRRRHASQEPVEEGQVYIG